MSWWDDETENLARQVIERFGDDAVTAAVRSASEAEARANWKSSEGFESGSDASATAFKDAIKVELRKLLVTH